MFSSRLCRNTCTPRILSLVVNRVWMWSQLNSSWCKRRRCRPILGNPSHRYAFLNFEASAVLGVTDAMSISINILSRYHYSLPSPRWFVKSCCAIVAKCYQNLFATLESDIYIAIRSVHSPQGRILGTLETSGQCGCNLTVLRDMRLTASLPIHSMAFTNTYEYPLLHNSCVIFRFSKLNLFEKSNIRSSWSWKIWLES